MNNQTAKLARMKTLWLLLPISILLAFTWFYFVRTALPFFAYFADPEVAYIFSALQLNEMGYVQMTDHPGTFLQIVGAGLGRLLSFDFKQAFVLDAYNQFRSAWLIFTLLAVAFALLQFWKLLGWSVCAFLIASLLLVHDYNTLMHFGRFTPEGGFLALYLVAAVLACRSITGAKELSFARALNWGALLGAVTTIKITLWPVTAFLIGAFFCLRSEAKMPRQLLAGALMLATALVAYFVVGSAFADDAADQMAWFKRLLTESGRYGKPNPEGSFLPFAQILSFTIQGFSFQSFTTLFPIVALSGFALWKLIRSQSTPLRLLSLGFLLCLALSFLIYAKHPYQIKYLLPQTYLLLAYFLIVGNYFRDELPQAKILRAVGLVLAMVAVNAFLNFHIVYGFNQNRYAAIKQEVSRIMQAQAVDNFYFSLEVPHELTAYGLGVREITDLLPLFEQTAPSLTVFRERNADYSISIAGSLPLEKIAPSSLIFTQRYFKDARAVLIYYDENLSLFVYLKEE